MSKLPSRNLDKVFVCKVCKLGGTSAEHLWRSNTYVCPGCLSEVEVS